MKTLEQQLIEQGWTPPQKKKEVSVGRFVPRVGEKYNFLLANGAQNIDEWVNDETDKCRFELGNCYRTRKEAIKAREIQKARVRISDALIKHQGDWVADWSDTKQPKYAIGYNLTTKTFMINSCTDNRYDETYSSSESCSLVMTTMQSDLNLIWG